MNLAAHRHARALCGAPALLFVGLSLAARGLWLDTARLDGSGPFPNRPAFPLRNFPRMMHLLASHYERMGEVDGVRIPRGRGGQAPPASREVTP
jgi:hypothetical protein